MRVDDLGLSRKDIHEARIIRDAETGTAGVPVSRRGFLGRLAGLSASALALGAVAGAAGPVVASAALPAPVAPAGAVHPLAALLASFHERSDTLDRRGEELTNDEWDALGDQRSDLIEKMIGDVTPLDLAGALAAVEALNYIGKEGDDDDPEAPLYYRWRAAMTGKLATFLRGLQEAVEGGRAHG
jgi:hypothetical protein